MFTFGIAGGEQGFDPLLLLLLALALEAYIGEAGLLAKVGWHPANAIGASIHSLDRKLNRQHRGELDRAVRGVLVAVVGAGLSLALGWAIAWLGQNHAFGWIVETVLLVLLLDQRGHYDRLRAVAGKLGEQGLEPAREAMARIAGDGGRPVDGHGVARAAVESSARNFCDEVVALVFWYLLFGFPGFLVCKVVSIMNTRIGHRTPHYRAFGLTAARLNDALVLIPARLAGLFIVIAALFTPTARPGQAWKIMLRDAGKYRSYNAGWPIAAVAGALNLTLAGPRRLAERTVAEPWIGGGSARAGDKDIRRALYLYLVACLVNAMWVAAFAVVRLALPE